MTVLSEYQYPGTDVLASVTYSQGRRNLVLMITVLTKPVNMDEILTLFHLKLPCLDYKAELGCLVSF